jgi:hypothetical protein
MAELALSVGFVVAVFLLPIAIAAGAIVMLLLASAAAAPLLSRWESTEQCDARLHFAGLNGFAVVDYKVTAELAAPPRAPLSTSLASRRADFRPF